MRRPIITWLLPVLLLWGGCLEAADYYWIGGSGNWSDISHWATTSGGTITHNTAPTAEDNVFFDANSFPDADPVITVNAANIFCRDMIWRGAANTPIFAGEADRILNIYGSLILIEEMRFEFAGRINLLGQQAGYEIDLAGHPIVGALFLEGEGGGWSLRAPLVVEGPLRLLNGTLSTNGQAVSCNSLEVNPAVAAALNLGASRVVITGESNKPNSVLANINGVNLDLQGAEAVFELSGMNSGLGVSGSGVFIREVRFTAGAGTATLRGPEENASATFGSVRFAANGSLRGAVEMTELLLNEGRFYSLQSGFRYRVGKLVAPGQCVAPIQLFSSASGSFATLESDGAGVEAEYLSVKDIHAEGSGAFRIENSADLGNNQGWTINSRPDNDLFWVGGSGSWDDPAHWSFTSGGLGGACIPTGADNVIFDANSFDGPGNAVQINVENAFCRDMTWTGATGMPILLGPLDRNLRVYGSLRLIAAMDYQFEGDVQFESPRAGNRITTAGHRLLQDVYFDGFEGDWELADPLVVAKDVLLLQGTLRTEGQPLTCGSFLSEDPRPRRLLLGASTITMQYFEAGFSRWLLQVANLEFEGSNAVIEFIGNGELTHRGEGALAYGSVLFRETGFISGYDNEGTSIRSLLFENSGTILHTWQVDTLALTAGYEYRFDVDNTLTLGRLIAEGDCDAYISIRSTIDDEPAYVEAENPISGSYLILKDIHGMRGAFEALSALDLGNNRGWTFNSRGAGRTLYWVGGAGNWEDTAHWSLSSGGAGGECIPTPEDDVIFDAASFDADEQTVYGWQVVDHYCRDMIWRDLDAAPILDIATLQLFGSLELAEVMTAGINLLKLRSDAPGNTLLTNGNALGNIIVEGSGDWRLADPISEAGHLRMLNGTLYTDDQDVVIQQFSADLEETPKALTLGGTQLLVQGEKFSWAVEKNADFTLQADSSHIEFTHPTGSMRNRVPLTFHNVRFTATSGESQLVTENGASLFNLVKFRKDGVIIGPHTFDTLQFSPGKAYRLEAGVTQTINEQFQIYGNNCAPIKLASTRPGQRSQIFMATGAVNGDFIQMRDQEATGEATFFAGIHSTDIGGSNLGWRFESAAAFVDVGFLGTDVVLCREEAVLLDAANNSENESYQWHDGSTGPTFSVTEPSAYSVRVSFGQDCEIEDEVVVLPPDAFQTGLVADTVLCEGEQLLLDATFDAVGVSYRWQDDSDSPTFQVSEPGEYRVELMLSGCSHVDSSFVDYTFPPQPDLGADTTLCHATALELDAAVAEATGYRWQDSTSLGPRFTVAEPGIYWVDLLVGRCPSRDSIVVDYFPAIAPDLGADTVLCEGEILPLQSPVAAAGYRWSDGSNGEQLEVSDPGAYWVDVTLNGCTERDSIEVRYLPLPAVDLGQDRTLCEGETVVLDGLARNGADRYLWSDSTTVSTLTVAEPGGTFWLETELDGCRRRDSIEVRYVIIPDTELGGDTVLCERETLRLDITLPNASYQWQDGSGTPSYTIREEGLYWGQVQVEQCTDRDSLYVRYKPRPQLEIGRDSLLCEGDVYELNLATNGESFAWQDGSTDPSYPVNQTGLYWATATLDGCSAGDSVLVEFQGRLEIDLGPDTTICSDVSYRLDPGFRGESYRWQNGSIEATMMVTEAGLYSVEIVDGACVLRDEVLVEKRECTYFTYYIPNAFSPNGDGVNDLLQVNFPPEMQVLRFEASIFDRWGNLLYQSEDQQMNWDGTFRSQALPSGIYVYIIKLDYIDDRRQDSEVITGDVMLLR